MDFTLFVNIKFRLNSNITTLRYKWCIGKPQKNGRNYDLILYRFFLDVWITSENGEKMKYFLREKKKSKEKKYGITNKKTYKKYLILFVLLLGFSYA